MILVIDVGNTNTVCGIYWKNALKYFWRMASDRNRSADEFGAMLNSFFRFESIAFSDVTAIVISSVVPDLMYPLEHMCRKYFLITPLVVRPGVKTGLNIKTDNPKEVGADRIVNAVAASQEYGFPVIVIDFGTATTYCAIDQKGDYIGGCIAPGVKISMQALYERAAQLPKIEIERPKKIIGKNTVDGMKSGIVYGYMGQVEYLIRRFKEEMDAPDAKTIATGGLARLIAEDCQGVDVVDPMLTLKGLKIIYDRNQ